MEKINSLVAHVEQLFAYSSAVMYTTNAIEAVNSDFRHQTCCFSLIPFSKCFICELLNFIAAERPTWALVRNQLDERMAAH